MTRSLLVAALLCTAAVASLLVLLPGCGKPPTTITDDGKNTKKSDPWEGVSGRLRKENDLSACKTALGQLNNDLSDRTDVEAASGLTDEAAKTLTALVPLSVDDLPELRPASFTSLDPAYLADCFYLRDAAHSLDPTGRPPIDLARLGFAWVCRQVYLLPWELDRNVFIPAVPPTFVLRRGYGSGLERAYVFLALLQQMGLDGCLIGSSHANEKPTLQPGKFNVQRGPFWAVGVRIGADIALFDPWRGEPFPGPDGKSIGTLAQVKADPNLLKAWFEDQANPSNVTLEEVKNAEVVLAVPLSALAPRLGTLEKKIHADTGVRLAIDAAALKARFAAAAPAGPGVEAKFWNPPADRFTYTRTLITFLPTEEGGLDREDRDARLYTQYYRSQLPRSLNDLPPNLKPQARERLWSNILGLYDKAFFVPPPPRERIQRGQFRDASRDLTQKLETFSRGLERLRQLDPAEIDPWCERANAAFDNLTQKRYPNPSQLTPQPDNDPEVIEAKAELELFLRNTDGIVRVLVDRATASIGRSEALFLLALSKHEEAERRQARGASEATTNAWREAANSWGSFLEQNGAAAQDVRTNHARKLAARAQSFIGK